MHYVLANGQHRAALVVNAWPGGSACNLTIELDWANDMWATVDAPTLIKQELIPVGTGAFTKDGVTLHAASVAQDEEQKKPGTWHWPERDA